MNWYPNLYKLTVNLTNELYHDENINYMDEVNVIRYLEKDQKVDVVKSKGNYKTFDVFVHYDRSYEILLGTHYRLDSVTKEMEVQFKVQGIGLADVRMRVPILDNPAISGNHTFNNDSSEDPKGSGTVTEVIRGGGTLTLTAIMAWTLTIELSGQNDAFMSDDVAVGDRVLVDGREIVVGSGLKFVTTVALPKDSPQAVGNKSLEISFKEGGNTVEGKYAYAFWMPRTGGGFEINKMVYGDTLANLGNDRLTALMYDVETKGDVTLQMSIYRVVNLTVDSKNPAGGPDIAFDRVALTDGGVLASNEYTVSGVDLAGNVTASIPVADLVYRGYTVTVSKLPEPLFPNKPLGTASTNITGNSAEYVIGPNADAVRISMYIPVKVGVTLDFGSTTSAQLATYNQYGPGNVRVPLKVLVKDQRLNPTVSEVQEFPIETLTAAMDKSSGKPFTLELDVPIMNSYVMEVSLPGFKVVSVSADSFQLVSEKYSVTYVSSDGTTVKKMDWDVLSKDGSLNYYDEKNPEGTASPFHPYRIGGSEVWMNSEGMKMGFVYGNISPSMFVSTGVSGGNVWSLVLKEYPALVPSDHIEKHRIYVHHDQWGTSVKLPEPFGTDAHFHIVDSVFADFDKATGMLALPAMDVSGTVVMIDFSRNYVLEVVTIADLQPVPHSIFEVVHTPVSV